jgi:MFS family permease
MAGSEAAGRSTLFSNRWWIVAASLIGGIVGPGTTVIFVVNVFMVPVTTELGWSRGLFSSGLLASAVAGPIMAPIFGYLMDRFGIRRVALPTIFFYALSLAGFALLQKDSVWVLYLMFIAASGFGACLSPMIYSKSITAWFDKERGLALGIATSGVGLGTVVLPSFAQYFITHYGWRTAYLAMAALTWLIAFSMVALFVREPPRDSEYIKGDGRDPGSAWHTFGVPVSAAAKDYKFWLLIIIFVIVGTANNGILSGHFDAMLVDRGYEPAEAAAILGISGLAAVAARIVIGFCLDWLNGPVFAAATMLLPALGAGLLASRAPAPAPVLAAICCGVAIGAEVDMLGFFVSRYFGRAAFGTIYGFIFAAFICGVGLGPTILGFGFDHYHTYQPVLWAYLIALIVAAVLFLPLGRYAYPKGRG